MSKWYDILKKIANRLSEIKTKYQGCKIFDLFSADGYTCLVYPYYTYIHTYISGLSSSFLETRVGRFGSTFHDAPPGHSV